MAAGDGLGTTVTFGSSGFSANILSVDGPSVTRDPIETTHMGTTVTKSFIMSSLYDGGEVTLTVQHDATIAVPISGALETITIDWGGLGSNDSFSGGVTAYTASATVGELMEGSMTIKAAGAITGI